MKKLLAALFLSLAGVCTAHADSQRIQVSSFTTTNDTAYISSSAYLVAIDVGGASTGGCLKIFSSTYTTSGVLVSSVSLGTVGNHYFGEDGVYMKGIYYTITGNVNGVTIVYKRF